MNKKWLLVTFVSIIFVILIFYPKSCGYDSGFGNFIAERCTCLGKIILDPFSSSNEWVDAGTEYACIGIKIGKNIKYDTTPVYISCKEKVCVSVEEKVIKKGEFGRIVVKISNKLDSQNFSMTMSRPIPSGYTKNNQEIKSDNLIWGPKVMEFLIEKNDENDLGVRIQVPANAVSGKYMFNLDITAQNGQKYVPTRKFLVEVP